MNDSLQDYDSVVSMKHEIKQCSPTEPSSCSVSENGKSPFAISKVLHFFILNPQTFITHTQFWNVALCDATKGYNDTSQVSDNDPGQVFVLQSETTSCLNQTRESLNKKQEALNRRQ